MSTSDGDHFWTENFNASVQYVTLQVIFHGDEEGPLIQML